MARLPVNINTSSLSFCHSSHVVVYFILLSVVSTTKIQVYVEFFLHAQANMRNWCLFHMYRVYFTHTVKSFCVNRNFLLFYLTNKMFISNNN